MSKFNELHVILDKIQYAMHDEVELSYWRSIPLGELINLAEAGAKVTQCETYDSHLDCWYMPDSDYQILVDSVVSIQNELDLIE